jgi:lysyl-tRNA synthetase class 2
VLGKTEVPYGDQVFDFGKPFEKLTMREAIKKYRPETEMADLDNFDSAKALAESIGIHVEKSWGLGRIVTEIFRRSGGSAPDSADLHHRIPGGSLSAGAP